MLVAADVQRLRGCLAGGGVVLFGADTVYGLACDPEQPAAVARLYELKGRPPRAARGGPVRVGRARAGEALPELHGRRARGGGRRCCRLR